ncbi:hypothetical protein vseg_018166 [Gypsophila vaccaria]
MLRACALEFQGSWGDQLDLIEFSYNNNYLGSIQMTPFEALYERKFKSLVCWDDMSEAVILRSPMIQEMVKHVHLIGQRMKVAQDKQKSYADLYRRSNEFQVGEKVLLKVLPMRGVMRFGKRGKLSQKFIGPYEILEHVGEVAYRLSLPTAYDQVHNVFFISQLWKYLSDPSPVIERETVEIDDTVL